MKKITIIVFVGAMVFACSQKTVVTTETKTKTETPSSEVKTKVETVEKAEVVGPAQPDEHAVSAETLAAGKTVYATRCGRCHGLKDVSAYTVTRWEPILKNMIPKARLNDEEARQVTAYVTANAKK